MSGPSAKARFTASRVRFRQAQSSTARRATTVKANVRRGIGRHSDGGGAVDGCGPVLVSAGELGAGQVVG